MAIQERRARQRAERHRLIVDTAREIAEAEGWDAVTTRRLAERIEYSQPVLYSHFSGKDAIVGAVALEGFTELVDALRAELAVTPDPAARLAAMARAYLRYAAAHPAVYAAMFSMDTDLTFADPASPAPLRAGFGLIRDVLGALTGERDLDARTELAWSTLHGLATLTEGKRLRPGQQQHRLDLFVAQLRPTSSAD
ncbi:MAG: TetR/AcrR family transcriptional regulator [Pseudonocardia sp.]|nr:TetR/AcrR family transcriptional regulator [Pseudonocardia sp.]